jgi:hypothetical protein
MAAQQAAYPVQFSVDYPDRPLNRLTSAFRISWPHPDRAWHVSLAGMAVELTREEPRW